MEAIFGSTLEEEIKREADSPVSDVLERVNQILGYDVLEENLMAEGYREMADESLRLAESSLIAGAEAFHLSDTSS